MKRYNKGDIIIGEFQVLDIFGGEGKSGMGVVYLVKSREQDLPIVLKTYQRSDNDSLKRFLSEAEIWINIGIHPNIVKAQFAREINDQLFIGAEYIKPDNYGRNSISDYLRQGGVSNFLAIKWAAQYCYAMDFALSKGLRVHRDIKPDNLMVDNGNLKVTDFGLAKAFYDFKIQNNSFQSTLNPNLTGQGSFLGTILYASPEQIIDSSKVDFRSDIYSFGIVLYQIIALGQFPYSLKGKTTIEHFAIMHLQEPLIKIKHPLFDIALKCLERKPKDRYNSYKELLKDLEKIAKKLNIAMPLNNVQKDDRLKELYIQSLSYLSMGNKQKSLDLINQYIEKDKFDSSTWSLKGRILYELGQINEGIQSTLRSLELDPYNSHTLNNLGVFYRNNGDKDKALKYLTESVEVDNFNSGAFMNLAIAFEDIGNYSLACDCIKRALELSPDKETLQFNASNIAALASKNSLFNKAIEVLEILIKHTPNNTNNLFNLALNYNAINQKEKAILYFQRVEQIIPDDAQVLISLARLNGELGRYDEALNYCEKMLDRKIELLKAISFKAQLMQAKGLSIEAINFIKAVLSNNQINDNLWNVLSDLYGNISDYKNALNCVLKAKSILTSQTEINHENLDYLNSKIEHYQRLMK